MDEEIVKGSCRSSRGADWEVLLKVGWDPKYGVAVEEIDRLEVEAGGHSGHDGVVLLARDVVESQCVPYNYVFVFYGPVPALQ